MRIAVLHPGEMGAAVAAALVDVGHEVCWRPVGRSPATRDRAEQAGLREQPDVAGCDVVLSICPPAAAIDTARSIGDFNGLYVDANAVSPATAARVMDLVTAGGADYVDGGIIGPPPVRAGTTRCYVSGSRAVEVVDLFAGARIEARLLDDGPFAASGLKMSYAAWTKVSAALLVSARRTARALGVDRALVDEWALSQPDLADQLVAAEGAATRKGWRWAEEMRQIAATFDAAGQPGGFGTAAAEVFGSFARPGD